MSRCFPFPPPGYQKKVRIEEADSLIKEKQKKEKKHKKEKKDKEKREGKEKKDKETSKDKHKEPKEKRENHKDRKHKDRDKEKSRTSEDKKAAGVLPNTGDREKLVTSTLQSNGNGESKFIQDLARRIRNDEATKSQSPRQIDFPGGVSENNISCSIPQTNHKKVDDKAINTHKSFTTVKRSETSVLDQKGGEVMAKPVEKKDLLKKKELLEMNQRRGSVTKSDKPLDNEAIKKSEPKNITDRSSKEKKREVINKSVQEKPKFIEGGPRLKEREHEHDSVDTRDFRVQDLSKGGVKNLTVEGTLVKGKDLEIDGLVYENGSRPHKIQRTVASHLSSGENGRSQTPPKPVSEFQGAVCNNPVLKEHRINGFIDPQEPKSRSPVSSVKVKEKGEASAKKRPHSDLKYLDQILNVPEVKELHEVETNEQEWLFGQSGEKLLKKQRTESTSSSDETPQVWNQALRIESADIVALPYVVPF